MFKGNIQRQVQKNGGVSVSPAAGALAPGFPGEKIGLSYEEAQQYNRIHGLKSKGFSISLPANSVSDPIELQVQGNGWIMLGISGHAKTNYNDDSQWPISFSIVLNTEKIIDEQTWSAIDIKYMTNIYWPFQRYLTGTDKYILTIDNSDADNQTVDFNIYYK